MSQVSRAPASALLERCQPLGIRLWMEAGELRFAAPRGALDSALRAELVANKPALLALLSLTVTADGPSRFRGPAAEPADPWPIDPPRSRASTAGWPPRDPELSTWSTAWRERWGRRTAELEAAGLSWQEAESRAFAEVQVERLAACPTP